MATKNWIIYVRKSLYVLGLLVLIAMLFALWKEQKKQICTAIEIEITAPTDLQLLDEAMIQDSIQRWFEGGLTALRLEQIDLQELEDRISAISAVDAAEVSTQPNGVLKVEVDQRLPIVRIYSTETTSFYLDYRAKRIGSDSYLPARVPIATGITTDSMIKKVYTLAAYVQENAFAEALVEQIFVTDAQELAILPKLYPHEVVIGEPKDLEQKFYLLENFYKYGLSKEGWDAYKRINLTFKNQIVCN